MSHRKVYPTDVTDEEWEFVAPYLTLMKEDAPQRMHALRDVFDAVRWMAKAACPWRLLPGDFPPWHVVEQQSKRWIRAGSSRRWCHDLRMIIRLLHERAEQPTAAILDGRTLQSSPESGARAGYDGYKRKKGSKVHIAVDTLGHLLALVVTPANEQERAQVDALPNRSRKPPSKAWNWPMWIKATRAKRRPKPRPRTASQLEVVKLADAKRGFVLLPRRWVVERSFAWLARFRRLSRDYERLPTTLAGLHWLAFACLLLGNLFRINPQS